MKLHLIAAAPFCTPAAPCLLSPTLESDCRSFIYLPAFGAQLLTWVSQVPLIWVKYLGHHGRGTTKPGAASGEALHHGQLLARLTSNAQAPEARSRWLNPGLIKGQVGGFQSEAFLIGADSQQERECTCQKRRKHLSTPDKAHTECLTRLVAGPLWHWVPSHPSGPTPVWAHAHGRRIFSPEDTDLGSAITLTHFSILSGVLWEHVLFL